MSKSIKFKHCATETIEIGIEPPSTSMSYALLIGAIACTKTHAPDLQYATDKDGLEVIIDNSVDLVSHLHDSIHAISVILAYADQGDIADYIGDAHWLIAGLADMASQVSHEAENMRFALNNQIETSPNK